MKRQELRKINQTFSIVKRREMSQFVSDAIRQKLESKKDELQKAYRLASKDEGQSKAMNEWESTISDGSDEW